MDDYYPEEVDYYVEMVDEVGCHHQKNCHHQKHQADLMDDWSHLMYRTVFEQDQKDRDHQVVNLQHHLRVVKSQGFWA